MLNERGIKKKLKREQRKLSLSLMRKGSKNRNKRRIKVAKMQEEVLPLQAEEDVT